jgi:hypothetical protein
MAMKIDNRLPRLVAVSLAVSGLGGAGWLPASPAGPLLGVRAAAADDTSKQTGSTSSTATVSAHASASVSSSGGSAGGCVVESTATADARAGEQHQRKSDHKRIERPAGPCEAKAEARANAQAGDSPPAETPPE